MIVDGGLGGGCGGGAEEEEGEEEEGLLPGFFVSLWIDRRTVGGRYVEMHVV